MPALTLAIPEEMKLKMDRCPEMNWSEVAREAIRQKLAQLQILKAIVSKSKLSEKEALEFSIELGRKVRAGIHERHLKARQS